MVQASAKWLVLLLKCLLLGATLIAASSCMDLSPDYAIASVKLPNGNPLYFKRQVWGLTGDKDLIAISANGNPCTEYSPATDYCICDGFRDYIYYKVEADTLHLYPSILKEPERFPFNLKVVNHDQDLIQTKQLEEKYQKMGFAKLDLKIDGSIKCQ